jgi:hypothetical protein
MPLPPTIGRDRIAATDPASASPNRINACFAIRAFAGVRTVCRQSRENPWRNAFGKVAACPASARQSSLPNTSTHLAHETQSKGEPAQRSGSNGVNQLPPIRVGTSAREHDFSGHRHAVAGASHLKISLTEEKFITSLYALISDEAVKPLLAKRELSGN